MSAEPADKGGMAEDEAREAARAILEHLLGKAPDELKVLGGGLSNHVFSVKGPEGDLVLRLAAEPGKVKQFLKEQWAIGRAAEADVPVPEVLEVGADPIPYMVARQVPGAPAMHHPDRLEVLRALGVQARRIHGIPTNGFGQTFDWSDNRLSRRDTWHDYLEREFHGERRLAILERHDMLPEGAADRLRETLTEIAGWDVEPRLNHGDLRLKNVLVDEGGEIAAVIDWELCTSNVAPYWDLSLALHDLGVDAKVAFLEGYGFGAEEITRAAPILRAFNVLNYAGEVARVAEAGEAPKLARLRARLHGALDLYAF